MFISIECTKVIITLNQNILDDFFVSDEPLLRGEIGLEGGFFNNFYEFFSKNRNVYHLFILYEHFVYIFKKIL